MENMQKMETILFPGKDSPYVVYDRTAVHSINGITPDENGDIAIELSEINLENVALKSDVERLTEEIASMGGGSGLPEGATAYQQLVTDGDGNAKWEDRAYYRKTVRKGLNDLAGSNMFPYTITTVADNGYNTASIPEIMSVLMLADGVSVEVWFDGKQYNNPEMVQWWWGASPTGESDSFDFSKYPFSINLMQGTIFTETAGEHTFDYYYYTESKVLNYGNVLRIKDKSQNNTRYLTMSDVEAIKTAWENENPITIETGFNNLSMVMQVTEVSSSFILASCVKTGNSLLTASYTRLYNCADGSIYRESCFYGGSLVDNASSYPVLHIRGTNYKIDIDKSTGTLIATELT